MLDLTYPIEEMISEGGYTDQAAVDQALQRLDLVVAWTGALLQLFKRQAVDAGEYAAIHGEPSTEQVSPELMEMLKNAAREQQAKRAEVEVEAAASGDAAKAKSVAQSGKLEQTTRRRRQKLQWQAATSGTYSLFLGTELWEAICWRRGSLRHLFATKRRGLIGATEAADIGTGSSDSPPDVTEDLLAEATGCLQLMLHAQGPVESDEHDPEIAWLSANLKEEEETKTLHAHGVYSSAHLLALKVTAELLYWLWRDFAPLNRPIAHSHSEASLSIAANGKAFNPDAEAEEAAAAAAAAEAQAQATAETAEVAAMAARTLREFVHICDDIMPGRGWTAKQEALWLDEVEGRAPLQSGGSGGGSGGGGGGGSKKKGKGKKKKR